MTSRSPTNAPTTFPLGNQTNLCVDTSLRYISVGKYAKLDDKKAGGEGVLKLNENFHVWSPFCLNVVHIALIRSNFFGLECFQLSSAQILNLFGFWLINNASRLMWLDP